MGTILDDDLEQHRALLDAWVEKKREIARLEAEAYELLAARVKVREADARENPHHREAIERSMIAEYSAAAHTSKYSIERAFADAAFLHCSSPQVAYASARESFQHGDITAAHVHEIVEAGFVVRQAVGEGRADAETLKLFDVAATVVAESDTPTRTRAQLRQLAASLVGETVVEQHKRAAGERSVSVRSVGDGLALLQVVLPEYLANAILDRLTQMARQVISVSGDREPVLSADVLDLGADPVFPEDLAPDDPLLDALDDPALDDRIIFGEGGTFTVDPFSDRDVEQIPSDERTMDQVRADLATDLLLASTPSEANGTGLDNIRGNVQVTISGSTLIGADDRPAELDGYGPIHPDIARDLASRNGGWTRLFQDPTGMVTETDTYSPTEGMRRFLRARDQHCRFPGCRMPVHRCQIDHNHDHAKGGRTEISNLCL
ncbi:HNH endonuclease signature motif containing protein, partial [Microbacterium sp. SD291]|uniref:HNH endonuclease signature motif containing protein n=1 Tax=Microbacterium sp. SD291 TaxID=2782007 RepID=UPI001A95B72F